MLKKIQLQKKIEVDVAVMPVTKAILNQADVISADIAIRYKLSDSFSAGLCASPTFIDYGYGETNYIPFFLSFRYNFMDNKIITPYLLLNLGGSFLQLEPDAEFKEGSLSGPISTFRSVALCSLKLVLPILPQETYGALPPSEYVFERPHFSEQKCKAYLNTYSTFSISREQRANHEVFALCRGEKTSVAKKRTFSISRTQISLLLW